MTEHPLTDEICCQLWQDNKDNWLKLQEPCPATRRVMRSAADWQLSQCLNYIRLTYGDEAMVPFMEAMRPQENNS